MSSDFSLCLLYILIIWVRASSNFPEERVEPSKGMSSTLHLVSSGRAVDMSSKGNRCGQGSDSSTHHMLAGIDLLFGQGDYLTLQKCGQGLLFFRNEFQISAMSSSHLAIIAW